MRACHETKIICNCRVAEDHGRHFHDITQDLWKNIRHDVVLLCNLKHIWRDTYILAFIGHQSFLKARWLVKNNFRCLNVVLTHPKKEVVTNPIKITSVNDEIWSYHFGMIMWIHVCDFHCKYSYTIHIIVQ